MDYVTHPLAPIVSVHSRALLLGTMPSPVSRSRGFYYAHPQNRFWKTLAAVYGAPVPETDAARAALILENGLALWDVLAGCEITGASDASIRNPVANDIPALLCRAPIERVFTTGMTAYRLYSRLVEPSTCIPATALPSPSAANARMSLADLTACYRAALLRE